MSESTQMNSETLNLGTKLDEVVNSMSGIRERLARIEALMETQADAHEKVDHIEARLGALGALNLPDLVERVSTLEKTNARVFGWVAGAVATTTVLGGGALWYLSHIIKALAAAT